MPSSSASDSYSRESTSICTGTRTPALRTAPSAAAMPPRRGDVIVLDHHRVVEADAMIPPARTAYFSKARSPGVVLRVSEIETPVPATSST